MTITNLAFIVYISRKLVANLKIPFTEETILITAMVKYTCIRKRSKNILHAINWNIKIHMPLYLLSKDEVIHQTEKHEILE